MFNTNTETNRPMLDTLNGVYQMIDAIEHVAENMVRITKTSMLSGLQRSMDLPVRQGHIDNWLGGALIQDAMPHLDPDQREFLMTGITPAEWDEAFA